MLVVCCLSQEEFLTSEDGTRFRNEIIGNDLNDPINISHIIHLTNTTATVKSTSALTIEEVIANITSYNNSFNPASRSQSIGLYNISEDNPYKTCQDLCAYLVDSVGCGAFIVLQRGYVYDDDVYNTYEDLDAICHVYKDYVIDLELRGTNETCSAPVESECCDVSFTENDTCVSVEVDSGSSSLSGSFFYVRVPDIPALVFSSGYGFQPLGEIVNRDFYYNSSLVDLCEPNCSSLELPVIEAVPGVASSVRYAYSRLFYTLSSADTCAAVCAYINENTTFGCGGYSIGDASYVCDALDPETFNIAICKASVGNATTCVPHPLWLRDVCPYGHPRPHVPCNSTKETVCYNGTTTNCGYYNLDYRNGTSWDLYVLTAVPPTASPTETPTHFPTASPVTVSPTNSPVSSSPTVSPMPAPITFISSATKSAKLMSYTDIAIGAAVCVSVIIMLVAVYFSNSLAKKGYVKISKK